MHHSSLLKIKLGTKHIRMNTLQDNSVDKSDTTTQEGVTWSEFTEHTTFHGIRYIFQSSFRIRQCVTWCPLLVSLRFPNDMWILVCCLSSFSQGTLDTLCRGCCHLLWRSSCTAYQRLLQVRNKRWRQGHLHRQASLSGRDALQSEQLPVSC